MARFQTAGELSAPFTTVPGVAMNNGSPVTKEDIDSLHKDDLEGISFAKVATRFLPSLVFVHVHDQEDNSFGGSGFFVDENTIITSSHVLINPNGIAVYLKDGKSLERTPIKIDHDYNIGLVKVNGMTEAYRPAKPSTLARIST